MVNIFCFRKERKIILSLKQIDLNLNIVNISDLEIAVPHWLLLNRFLQSISEYLPEIDILRIFIPFEIK